MTNQCVICGCEIPDGKQVCTGCEIKSNADLEADLKAAHEEIGRLRAGNKVNEFAEKVKTNMSYFGYQYQPRTGIEYFGDVDVKSFNKLIDKLAKEFGAE